MKNGKIALGVSVIVLAVVVAMLAIVPSALAQPPYPANSTYFMPEHSTGEYCQNNTIVQINVSTTVATTGVQMDIHFDPCVNITAVDWTGGAWQPFVPPGWTHYGSYVTLSGTDFLGQAAGDWKYANITLHCINDTYHCTSCLNISNAVISDNAPIPKQVQNVATHNGTITCEAAPQPEEAYTKYLVTGWNLISLPLMPTAGNESTNKVLETVSYNAVYRYNATSNEFENATGTTMNLGIGYFVHVTTAGTWTYNGTACSSMDILLKSGLNMVGWLNCSKDISDALSSIDANYYYAASWNATEQKFESYNPVAPALFNNFDRLERGTGYFISAKSETALTESCT